MGLPPYRHPSTGRGRAALLPAPTLPVVAAPPRNATDRPTERQLVLQPVRRELPRPVDAGAVSTGDRCGHRPHFPSLSALISHHRRRRPRHAAAPRPVPATPTKTGYPQLDRQDPREQLRDTRNTRNRPDIVTGEQCSHRDVSTREHHQQAARNPARRGGAMTCRPHRSTVDSTSPRSAIGAVTARAARGPDRRPT